MDKCGLITFHRTSNFGSALQTYALYRKICDLGVSCEIIDYRCDAIEKRESLKVELRSIKEVLKYIFFTRVKIQKAKQLDDFIKNTACISKPYTINDIKDADQVYGKFIIGSDIVWGRDITEDDMTYFLDFVSDDRKKYAFAASVGNYGDRFNDAIVGEYLSRFQRIAVREEEAVNWVERLSGIKADWVCDPTMLLTVEEWEQVININLDLGNYVLVYFIDDKKKAIMDAIEYAKEHGLKVVLINYSRPVKGAKNIRPTSLEEFLSLIKNASFVFTASYHGMLFSLYFHRQFLFYTRAHKTRFLSLADTLNVSFCCGDDLTIDRIKPIDYNEVEKRICRLRNQSIALLADMLNK